MEERSFLTSKTARFAIAGNEQSPDRVYVVIHGYGQLSRYFIRKFEPLIQENTLVVAPEGLHRYYIDGSAGRVGASWMTKEDRLSDIQDYISYLDELISSVLSKCQNNPELVVLGFSQGGATACRWAAIGKVKCDKLYLWAASFPPDLDLHAHHDRLHKLRPTIVYGRDDEVIQSDYVTHVSQLLEENNIPFEVISYKGRHEINRDVLIKIFNEN